jgi:hypothetical protein
MCSSLPIQSSLANVVAWTTSPIRALRQSLLAKAESSARLKLKWRNPHSISRRACSWL